MRNCKGNYRKQLKNWESSSRTNSVDSDQTAPKEQSDQGLHCLAFCYAGHTVGSKPTFHLLLGE